MSGVRARRSEAAATGRPASTPTSRSPRARSSGGRSRRARPKGLYGWHANNSPDRPTGPLSFASDTSGRLFSEEYHAQAKLARAGPGTPHLDGNTRICTATAEWPRGAVFVPFHYGHWDEANGTGPGSRPRAANELTITRRPHQPHERRPADRDGRPPGRQPATPTDHRDFDGVPVGRWTPPFASSLSAIDLVLLIVLDAIQQGLARDDYSVTAALIAVSTIAPMQLRSSYLGSDRRACGRCSTRCAGRSPRPAAPSRSSRRADRGCPSTLRRRNRRDRRCASPGASGSPQPARGRGRERPRRAPHRRRAAPGRSRARARRSPPP